MAGEKYVLVYVDPALDDGYLIWPLPTDRSTVVGVTDVAGECSTVNKPNLLKAFLYFFF